MKTKRFIYCMFLSAPLLAMDTPLEDSNPHKPLPEDRNLLQPSLDLNEKHQKVTALVQAIQDENVGAVASLCRQSGVDVNIPVGNRGSLLHMAITDARKESLKIIRLLADKGASMESINAFSFSPLQTAIVFSQALRNGYLNTSPCSSCLRRKSGSSKSSRSRWTIIWAN